MVQRISVFMVLVLATLPRPLVAQGADASRIAALEADLRSAQARVAELESTLHELAAAVVELKGAPASPAARLETRATESATGAYAERIVVANLGGDERAEELRPKPELFVQTAYFANRIDGATADDAALNFSLNRMELAWKGRIGERFGMGYEIQYHPAPDGASEELVNDAYVEYYLSDALTLRMGQFVKPFGFDIQHSSADRESPERGVFAGYFFPGQRDRGLSLRADLGEWLSGLTLDAAVFNGNRFFADNNDDLNYNMRVRRVFPSQRLAIGASYQAGTQVLPPGAAGDDDEDAYGVDLQLVVGRLGMRAEYVRGNTPSTLLGLEPEFAPGFTPGEKSWGAAAFFNWNLTSRDDVYWRWDRFDNDPVTSNNPRAFNLGYLRRISGTSRLGIDYQWKDDVTFNDDELNTRLALRWDIVY
jgi:hypothetical protein